MSNIISINQMIDYIDDFVWDNKQTRTIVGGIIGTDLCKLVLESVMTRYGINNIGIIEGCQDYIGFDKVIMTNHMFYGDLFYDVLSDPLNGQQIDSFKPKCFQPKPSHNFGINMSMINTYDIIIINDAHLIPDFFLMNIINNYSGKIISIVDPFDIGGEPYSPVYLVTDTLIKLAPMLAMARAVYNVDTRFIDKKFKGSIKEGNISKRSVGKIDDKQYITNDEYLCSIIRDKQLNSKFHKNQKMIVTSNKINLKYDSATGKKVSLPRNSMVTLQSASISGLYMKFRLYSSKIIINDIDVTYLNNSDSNAIEVKPANILNIDEAHHHHYKHSVLVCDDINSISDIQKYSILKNSLELTIGYVKM